MGFSMLWALLVSCPNPAGLHARVVRRGRDKDIAGDTETTALRMIPHVPGNPKKYTRLAPTFVACLVLSETLCRCSRKQKQETTRC